MQNYTQVDSLMSMNNELKESLCNHLAVAGVENVISTDATEIWTLLDLPEPENYDYEADSHTDIIEKASELFEKCNDWSVDNGYKTMNQTAFGLDIKQFKGIQKKSISD